MTKFNSDLSESLFFGYKTDISYPKINDSITSQLDQYELTTFINQSIENNENIQTCFDDVLLQVCNDLSNDSDFIEFYTTQVQKSL
jgi:hypothetical protein